MLKELLYHLLVALEYNNNLVKLESETRPCLHFLNTSFTHTHTGPLGQPHISENKQSPPLLFRRTYSDLIALQNYNKIVIYFMLDSRDRLTAIANVSHNSRKKKTMTSVADKRKRKNYTHHTHQLSLRMFLEFHVGKYVGGSILLTRKGTGKRSNLIFSGDV